ncbi:MAG TPA: hypothetical protein DEF51_25975, partial [Myxococcales bacterium]|nr:hypothetical protein [Myxococcales bacterium]
MTRGLRVSALLVAIAGLFAVALAWYFPLTLGGPDSLDALEAQRFASLLAHGTNVLTWLVHAGVAAWVAARLTSTPRRYAYGAAVVFALAAAGEVLLPGTFEP